MTWALFALDAFSLRTPFLQRLTAVVTAEVGFESLRVSLGTILAFALTIWIAVLLSRFIRFLLEEDIYDRFHFAPGASYAISTLLHYVILLVGFLVAIAALGVDMTKFTVLAGAFGVGLGFGLQNIINNFVSGLVLLFERPVNVGDVVQIENDIGVIRRIGIRASIIRLFDSSELIVPNGKLISEKVTNWTLSNRQRRIEVRVGVAYGTDPKRVIELLKRVAAAHPLAAKHPEPQALMTEFGSDSLNFVVQVLDRRLRPMASDPERRHRRNQRRLGRSEDYHSLSAAGSAFAEHRSFRRPGARDETGGFRWTRKVIPLPFRRTSIRQSPFSLPAAPWR